MEIEKARAARALIAQYEFYGKLVAYLNEAIEQNLPLIFTDVREADRGNRYALPEEVVPEVRRIYQKLQAFVKSELEKL